MKQLKIEDFNEQEIEKCKKDPLYFYNTYILPKGKKPLTQEEYNSMIKQVELYRNSIPIRMRRGNYVFMRPINPQDAISPSGIN